MSLRAARFTPPHTSTLPDFHVGDVENELGNEHWVSRLFQPTYSEVGSSEEMKTILGNRLSAIDPVALRNVFYRVHALLTEQKEQLEQPAPKPTVTARAPVETVTAEPRPPVDEACIWDESEISILRSEFKRVRDENKKLHSHLKFAEQRLASLDAKYSKIRHSNEENLLQLNEARKANSRLNILAKTLKQDMKNTKAENDNLNEQLKSLRLEKLDLIDKLKSARIESDQDRIAKKKLEVEIRENGRILIETASHLESKLRVRYQTEVNKLNVIIDDLRDQLEEEKRSHEAARKGLDHLRTHFASMPIEQGILKDELKDLKLY